MSDRDPPFQLVNEGYSLEGSVSVAGHGISAPVARRNAPFSLRKSLPMRSSPQSPIATGRFQSRACCAACSSANDRC
jgi:hypothetical protein